MSKIDSLIGSPKEVEINGEKITIYPLPIRHTLRLLPDLRMPEKQGAALSELVTESLKRSFPGEENRVGEIATEYLGVLIETILDVNKLQVPGEIKDKLKETPFQ